MRRKPIIKVAKLMSVYFCKLVYAVSGFNDNALCLLNDPKITE